MVNRELAEQRGLFEEEILEIDRIHDLIAKFTRAWIKEPFSEARKEEIHDMEYILQSLWGFPKDRGYHRYAREYEFKCNWAGRRYRCIKSGEVFEIPYDTYETACYFFGDGAMVDVGRLNAYSRFSNVVKIVNDSEETE